MCGIAGICHLSGPGRISPEDLTGMLGVVRHRGPDSSGIYLDDRVGLAHNRLSIIDLSEGVQPIHNEDETLWIVYNGEVFNYLELREELLTRGHRFYTATDTEVILHLFEEKGPRCLDDLNGQFAFAIWNRRDKELFLARDRLGIRPLHYTIRDGRIIFASEVKSIFTLDNVPRQIDPIALDQIFTFWSTLSGRTIFRDIYELLPGHSLEAARGGFTIRKYWEIPFYPPEEYHPGSVDELCEGVLELLTDAIRLRLRADVPVGCYVSGGLDSSGVAALTRRNFSNHLRTFGIRFEEAAFDETEYQNEMIAFLETDHTSILARNDQIGTRFPEVLWHCEKPLLRTAPVPLFFLSEAVRDSGFKVVLTGEGADEVFGGYNIFRETKIRKFWARQPDSKMRPSLIGKLYPYIFKDERLKVMLQSFFGRELDKVDDPFFSHSLRWQNTGRTKMFFSPELQAAASAHDSYEELRSSLPQFYPRWDTLAKAQYLEMAIFLSNYLLSSQGDRVAMAHSVETRMPYLDYRIVEFMARVPSNFKIQGLDEKHLLKKAFQGLLPDRIRRRPKHPYRAPIRQSLLNGDCATSCTQEMLSDSFLKATGFFDGVKVKRLIDKMKSAQPEGETNDMALAGILTTQLIHHQFIAGFPFKPPEPVHVSLVADFRSEQPPMRRKTLR